MGDINIEEIMKEIRRNIAERAYKDPPVEFDDIIPDSYLIKRNEQFSRFEFQNEINYLNSNWMNSWNIPIDSKNIFVWFIKKVIMKLTRFIVFPIINFQNEYNASVIRCFNQLDIFTMRDNSYENRIADLEKQIVLLQKRIDREDS
jgi:hypothetical protein